MKLKSLFTLILVSVLSFSIVIHGSDTLKKIEAYFASDIHFQVDGEHWIPKDVDGSTLIPIRERYS